MQTRLTLTNQQSFCSLACPVAFLISEICFLRAETQSTMSGNKGGVLSRVFGGSSKGGAKVKTAQTPQEAIQQLRDVEDVLNKKVEHLEGKINEETAIARRDARTNKRNALNALKRKKRLEKTLQQIDGTLTTLEYQREALQVRRVSCPMRTGKIDETFLSSECLDERSSIQCFEECHECTEECSQRARRGKRSRYHG